MKATSPFSVKKRILSIKHGIRGIVTMLRMEHNSRIHLTVLLIVIILGIFLQIKLSEWAIIAVVSGMVIISELFNTAIEDMADIVHPDWDQKIGRIKDYTAGAVLIAAIISLIAGFIIFVPKVINIMGVL